MQKLIVLLIVSAVVSGCAYAPGSHIEAGKSGSFYNGQKENESVDYSELIRVSQINADILFDPSVMTVPAPSTNLIQPDEAYEYRVGVGDVLQVIVWDHPELTIPAGENRSSAETGNVVNSDGTIYYPYIGYVQAAGKTTIEIREDIASRLARFIESPEVDVSVASFQSRRIYISGAVETPGVYPLTNVPTRLVDAISQAGGIDEGADWRNVILTREGKDYRLSLKAILESGNTQHNVLLQSGDVVTVPLGDDQKVFVLGQVVRTQTLPMGRNGLTLAEAISNVGGLDERQAEATGVFVIRRADDTDADKPIDLFQLDMSDATALVLADRFVLNDRDLIYVTTAPAARWNRVISLLTPSFSALFLGDRAADLLE